jgi:hypothetical protein
VPADELEAAANARRMLRTAEAVMVASAADSPRTAERFVDAAAVADAALICLDVLRATAATLVELATEKIEEKLLDATAAKNRSCAVCPWTI